MCRTSWLRFLGIGKQRWDRTKKRYRGVDDRTLPRNMVNNAITLNFKLFVVYFLVVSGMMIARYSKLF